MPNTNDNNRAPTDTELYRRRPAHGVIPHIDRPTIVFLTVCTRQRQPWLAAQEVHEKLVSIWRAADAWKVGRYVLMPDHLHLFAGLGEEEFPFDNWVRYWKSQYTKNRCRPDHVWQTEHWDRRLRTDESYDVKWEYVRSNPVRHGLVASAEQWPFQGELHHLSW